MPNPNEILLLTSDEEKNFAKTAMFKSDGTIIKGRGQFPNPHRPSLIPELRTLQSLQDIADLLEELRTRTDTYVVRAALSPIAPKDGPMYPRWANRDKSTNHLTDTPRSWLSIDIDDLPVKEYLGEGWRGNVHEIMDKTIRAALPEEFWGCGWVAQFSTGMRPDGKNLRVHIWFQLSEPIYSSEAKRLLGVSIQKGFVDGAALRAGQAIYTALISKDEYGSIIGDPLGDYRIVLHEGLPVEVGDIPETGPDGINTFATVPINTSPIGDLDELRQRLQPVIDRIGDRREAGPEIGFREGLLSLTLTYARLTYTFERDSEWLRQIAIEKTEADDFAALTKDWDRDHIYGERLGRDFDNHYQGACEKVDANPTAWVYNGRMPADLVAAILAKRERDAAKKLNARTVAAREAFARLKLKQPAFSVEWLLASRQNIKTVLHFSRKEGEEDLTIVAEALLEGTIVLS